MQKYNFLQAIYMSFYSRDLYRDIVRNWSGKAVIGYLFLILGLCWAILTGYVQWEINTYVTPLIAEVVPQIPDMTITNGVIKTPENKPYYVKDPTSSDMLAIIDTSGQHLNLEAVTAKLLVIKTAILTRNSSIITIHKLSPQLNLVIKPAEIRDSIYAWLIWVWIFLFPVFLILSFVYRFLLGHVFSVIGKIFTVLSAGASLPYSDIFKLAIVTFTPGLILETVLSLFLGVFHTQWLLSFIISLVYLIYAIGANKADTKTPLLDLKQ
jgi:hypothetical protein